MWDESLKKVVFIMLNPSTADAFKDDPTVRKCVSFAKHWNFGSLEIVNLFAYRATNPKDLKEICKNGTFDPVGKENDFYIIEAIKNADKIVIAWGKNSFCSRDSAVLSLLKNYKLYCLDTCKNGNPKHPLFLALDTELKNYI
ncbi:DUF1643 domain-containing protein [Clostridium tyrobutyricum]|uniref:DUF1643 domain-containing protein n=1 Tax=Clostridium tyrobutyricum TaxID=1519 RepID=UPI0039F70D28